MKRFLIGMVLADFVALNVWVVAQYGIVGFLEAATANLATIAVMVDLVIALSLVLAWIWQDARARGVSPLPYAALTAMLGSVGPLLYLLLRRDEPARAAAMQGAPAARLQPRAS
jgi:hypothetical protein